MKKIQAGIWTLALVALMGGQRLNAQAKLIEKVEAAPGEAKVSYEKYELPNGLIVYIHEDHSDPMVHVEVTYKVGSNREHIGISGFAHFFEHMMFQGSKHVADEEHIQTIEGAGGRMNGTTNEDRTNYFETLPSNMLETALWLESDRMGWLLPAVTKEKFEIQRSAVKNEKEQNVVNQPYALPLSELYLRDLYPEGHPYSWPIIGYVEDLDRVTVDDMKKFFLRWYGPNNAILVIAGDVDPKSTMAMVEKYFGPIPRGQEVKPIKAEPVILQQDVYRTYYDNVQIPVIRTIFSTIPNYHRDEAALDILSEILGGGRNSIIYQSLVKSDFAIEAAVMHPCKELSGEFTFQVVSHPKVFYSMEPGKLQTLVSDSVKAIISRFDPMTITDDELNRIKTSFESDFINVLESVQGKAGRLTDWERLQGKTWNLEDEIKRYKAVTRQDLKRVFEKYIKNRGSLVAMVYPAAVPEQKTQSDHPYPGVVDQNGEKQYAGLTYTEPVSTFDRSKKPEVPAAKPAVVPQYSVEKFDNGLKLIHTRNNELPKTTVFIRIAGGKMMEAYNPKLLGLASVTATMMDEGTELRTSEELTAALDALGSSISFSGGSLSTNITVTALTKNLDATLAILEEMLFKPRFDPKDLKRVLEQSEEGVRNGNKNPGVLASKAFGILAFGDNILASSTGGYLNTLGKIGVNDVRDFYNKYYSPSVTTVTVVSNEDVKTLMPKFQFLSKWKAKEVKMPTVTNFPEKKPTTIYLVDMPGATQSQIIFGKRMLPYDYNGDFYKLNIANYSLGGSFNSRININLREEKGYTYGAYAGLSGNEFSGIWGVQTSVKIQATDSALNEIYKELKNFHANGIQEKELDITKKSINQSSALQYETSYDKAGYLSQILTYNLPSNFSEKETEILNNITKPELDALIKQYLNPDEMIIVVVGDASDIKAKLKALAFAKLTTIDPDKVKVIPAK